MIIMELNTRTTKEGEDEAAKEQQLHHYEEKKNGDPRFHNEPE